MVYKTYIPSARLAAYVKCYWSLENDDRSVPVSRDRIFPDGCIEMVFHYGDLFRKFASNNTGEIQQRGFIHGQLTEYMELEATGKTGIFSIRFQPNGLKAFIPFELHELTGKTAGLKEAWGNEGDELEDRMLNAKTNDERLIIIENFLHSKLGQRTEKDVVIDHCVNAIVQNNGNITIDQLAIEFAIGRRHLERKFSAGVGISPKLLSRIIRFQNALQLIENKQFSSLTMVAYEGGFYDQAHFIKDFKEFTGLNPKQYFSEKLEIARYLANE